MLRLKLNHSNKRGPISLCHQGISSHNTDYMKADSWLSCLPRERISYDLNNFNINGYYKQFFGHSWNDSDIFMNKSISCENHQQYTIVTKKSLFMVLCKLLFNFLHILSCEHILCTEFQTHTHLAREICDRSLWCHRGDRIPPCLSLLEGSRLFPCDTDTQWPWSKTCDPTCLCNKKYKVQLLGEWTHWPWEIGLDCICLPLSDWVIFFF